MIRQFPTIIQFHSYCRALYHCLATGKCTFLKRRPPSTCPSAPPEPTPPVPETLPVGAPGPPAGTIYTTDIIENLYRGFGKTERASEATQGLRSLEPTRVRPLLVLLECRQACLGEGSCSGGGRRVPPHTPAGGHK